VTEITPEVLLPGGRRQPRGSGIGTYRMGYPLPSEESSNARHWAIAVSQSRRLME
jgi:hypothetical protein